VERKHAPTPKAFSSDVDDGTLRRRSSATATARLAATQLVSAHETFCAALAATKPKNKSGLTRITFSFWTHRENRPASKPLSDKVDDFAHDATYSAALIRTASITFAISGNETCSSALMGKANWISIRLKVAA
jgi:hypothetical protein